jgi:hypothetical protein
MPWYDYESWAELLRESVSMVESAPDCKNGSGTIGFGTGNDIGGEGRKF